jgi:hypothetical protein
MSYLIRDGDDEPQTMAAAGNGQGAGIISEYNRYGTTGTDYSANPSNIPADNTSVVILTIPVNEDRALLFIQNQSAATLQVVRSDGVGGHRTSLFLVGLWQTYESSTFKGQIDVYGPATAQVAAFED